MRPGRTRTTREETPGGSARWWTSRASGACCACAGRAAHAPGRAAPLPQRPDAVVACPAGRRAAEVVSRVSVTDSSFRSPPSPPTPKPRPTAANSTQTGGSHEKERRLSGLQERAGEVAQGAQQIARRSVQVAEGSLAELWEHSRETRGIGVAHLCWQGQQLLRVFPSPATCVGFWQSWQGILFPVWGRCGPSTCFPATRVGA